MTTDTLLDRAFTHLISAARHLLDAKRGLERLRLYHVRRRLNLFGDHYRDN